MLSEVAASTSGATSADIVVQCTVGLSLRGPGHDKTRALQKGCKDALNNPIFSRHRDFSELVL